MSTMSAARGVLSQEMSRVAASAHEYATGAKAKAKAKAEAEAEAEAKAKAEAEAKAAEAERLQAKKEEELKAKKEEELKAKRLEDEAEEAKIKKETALLGYQKVDWSKDYWRNTTHLTKHNFYAYDYVKEQIAAIEVTRLRYQPPYDDVFYKGVDSSDEQIVIETQPEKYGTNGSYTPDIYLKEADFGKKGGRKSRRIKKKSNKSCRLKKRFKIKRTKRR